MEIRISVNACSSELKFLFFVKKLFLGENAFLQSLKVQFVKKSNILPRDYCMG